MPRIIDADLHVIEPWDLYLRYMDPRWGDRVPRYPRPEGRRLYPAGPDGNSYGPFRTADGTPIRAVEPNIQATLSSASDRLASLRPYYEDATTRDFDAGSTLQAMDREGIDIAVLFRTFPLHGDERFEPEYAIDICRAWNSWCSDYVREDDQRLKFAALITFHDIDLAVQEARRAVRELGAVGLCIMPEPIHGHLLHDACFDPFWGAAEDLGVPICVHPTPNTNQLHVCNRFLDHPNFGLIARALRNPVEEILAVAQFCSGGILERFPRLKVAFLEANCGWLPWLLYRLDEVYEKMGPSADVQLSLKPSDYFRRQCFIAADVDEEGVADVLRLLGDDFIISSTDYPHDDCQYPFATEILTKTLEGLSETSKQRVLAGNAARLYGLESAVAHGSVA